MDAKHFELLLRDSPFCRALLAELWGGLTTKERIDLLLYFAGPSGPGLPKELLAKTLDDQSPLVRTLAVKGSYISKRDDPELYTKVKADPSPFVRAAIDASSWGQLSFDTKYILAMSQLERLGAIALSSSVDEESFAKFIIDSLQNHAISENEAAELVKEFVRNPGSLISYSMVNMPNMEGSDFYWIKMNREKIWNLTTCTPLKVHYWIVWEYPLETDLFNNIPDEMLDCMGDSTLAAIAFRQYWPLLERLQATPEKFGKGVHDSAKLGAKDRVIGRGESRSDVDELRVQLTEFRTEMRRLFDAVTANREPRSDDVDELRKEFTKLRTEMQELFRQLERQIVESVSRRRGFFR